MIYPVAMENPQLALPWMRLWTPKTWARTVEIQVAEFTMVDLVEHEKELQTITIMP